MVIFRRNWVSPLCWWSKEKESKSVDKEVSYW